MDRRRLRPDVRGVPDHRRQARRPARPAPDVLDRAGAVHGQLGGVRVGADVVDARRRPPGPGGGRRADDAQRDVDHHRRVHRRRTRQGAVGLRDGDGPGRRRRAADRRRPGPGEHPRARLAQLLLDQCPDRIGRAGARAPTGARVTRSPRPPARSCRHRARHGRPDRDRPAARRRPPARLAGLDVDLAGDRTVAPGRVRGPAAPARPSRRRTTARPDAVPGADVLAPGCSRSSCSGAARRHSSWSSRCTCSRAGG